MIYTTSYTNTNTKPILDSAINSTAIDNTHLIINDDKKKKTYTGYYHYYHHYYYYQHYY